MSDDSRHAGPCGDGVADRQIAPAQVDREPPHTGFLIDQARNDDAATRQPDGTNSGGRGG